MADKARLQALLDADNILDLLEPSEIGRTAALVIETFEEDDQDPARMLKKERWAKGKELVKQTIEKKNTPWEGAANIKYPLMTTACIQFNSRAFPEIVQGNSVVRPKVMGHADGEKLKRAERVAEFHNWQLFNEITEWEEDTDRLLLMLPAYGTMFRKVYYDPAKKRVCTAIKTPEVLVVPDDTQSLDTAIRISETFELRPREITERVRTKAWREVPIDDPEHEGLEKFVQQQLYLDLDDDGYKEPYIAIVHLESETLVRLWANYKMDDIEADDEGNVTKITPQTYYVKYSFIPSIDGSFYDLGFYDLLYPINETVNTILNQLTDAGTLANSNSGFIGTDVKFRKRGDIRFELGKFIGVASAGDDIRKGIVQMQFPGPSPVMFSLLDFILGAGKEIANLKEVLEGDIQKNMQPTTVMALIEQGLKVYSGIHKRVHRAVSDELQLIRYWNYITRNPAYDLVLDRADEDLTFEDFREDDLDFVLVSDPAVVTDMQKMARVQFRMQFINDPYFNQQELRRQIWEGAGMEGFDELKAEESPENQQIQQLSGMVQQLMGVVQGLQQKVDEDQKLLVADERRKERESRAKAKELLTRALKNVADAEAVEAGPQIDLYQKILDKLGLEDDERGTGGVAGKPSNAPRSAGIPGDGVGYPEPGNQGGGIDPAGVLAAITQEGA